MRHLTREQALRESGASPQELADLESRQLIVANRSRRFLGAFGETEEYYTEGQVGVIRWLVSTRRTAEASRR
jgi:hypothetical protein